MAVHICGNPTPGQNVFRHRSDINGRWTEFFALRGLVHICSETLDEGNQSEHYDSCNYIEFLARTTALNLEVKALIRQARRAGSVQKSRALSAEAMDKQRLVACMAQAAAAARDQGSPFDPRTSEYYRKHKPGPARVGFSRHNWSTGMPPEPKGPATGPVKDLGGAQVYDIRKQLILPGR